MYTHVQYTSSCRIWYILYQHQHQPPTQMFNFAPNNPPTQDQPQCTEPLWLVLIHTGASTHLPPPWVGQHSVTAATKALHKLPSSVGGLRCCFHMACKGGDAVLKHGNPSCQAHWGSVWSGVDMGVDMGVVADGCMVGGCSCEGRASSNTTLVNKPHTVDLSNQMCLLCMMQGRAAQGGSAALATDGGCQDLAVLQPQLLALMLLFLQHHCTVLLPCCFDVNCSASCSKQISLYQV